MNHLVFVYGSLLTGLHNHGLLQQHNARLVACGRTVDANFLMIDLGRFPGVVPQWMVPLWKGTRIAGELYKVDDATLEALDELEGHPRFYTRRRVELVVEGQKITAWMYLLNQRCCRFRWDPKLVPNGDWKAFRFGDGEV